LLTGYKDLHKIYESNRTSVYRGVRNKDRLPVILKLLKTDYPSQKDIIEYRHEYELSSSLILKGVTGLLGFEKYNNNPVIIFEDFGGTSLNTLLASRKFTLKEFLSIASKISDILSLIYDADIIHMDINPANIILNPETWEVRLIDFGLARKFSEEITYQKLKGNPRYISPEQTGRTDSYVDYRSDFYSLGVTFYELLTGSPPFVSNDLMELIHSHLAKDPLPPCKINHDIPEMISHIVMKLIAKNSDERYQSPWGLKRDIDECMRQLNETGKINFFPICTQDIPSMFYIPQKLYGRKEEVKLLLHNYRDVCTGSNEALFISGYSGIGKTSLVKEFYTLITGAYLIKGKYEQFDRNSPYSAIVSALQELIEKILSEKDFFVWKEKMCSALGNNGQILIDIFPRLELITGPQEDVENTGSIETQNRFNHLFLNFLRIFCDREHPLVIFLDDLQWADLSSLKLIEFIMTDKTIKYLFFIGAYRDNEVDITHPLSMTLDLLRKSDVSIKEIHLAPLYVEHVHQMISDTIYNKDNYTGELSELVRKNTDGNPFFIKHYLERLYKENILFFNKETRSWQCELHRIGEAGITENLAYILTGKIGALPYETKKLLQVAACLGNTFEISHLSIICEESPYEIYKTILPALEEGFICPASEHKFEDSEDILSKTFYKNYKFLHDSIQLYTLLLLGDYERKELNLRAGRKLFYNLCDGELKKRIFEVTGYFNNAKELVTEESEKIQLIRLNLRAGKKAKNSIAYSEALNYLNHCYEYMPHNIWDVYYELAFSLYREFAEILYLNGHYEEAQKLICLALEKSKSSFEQTELYALLIIQFTMMAKYEEAIFTGKKALSLLGVDLSLTEIDTVINEEIYLIKNMLADREVVSLIDLPLMTDIEKKQIMKILSYIAAPSYYSDKKIFFLVSAKKVRLSLEYGNVPESCFGYTIYGMVNALILGDYAGAYDFGLLGVQLSEKFKSPVNKCRTSVIFGNYIFPWMKNVRAIEEINQEGYQAGLAGGELEYAGYCLTHIAENYFYLSNKSLKDILSVIREYMPFVNKTVNSLSIDLFTGLKMALFNLSGFTKDKWSFYTDDMEEEQFLHMCFYNKTYMALCFYYIFKLQILYLYGNVSEALVYIMKAKELLDYILIYYSVDYNFYYSLILSDLYDTCGEEKYMEQIKANQRQMKVWSDNCPQNFLHKYLLVEAELFRISGREMDALDFYNQAIVQAGKYEFMKDEALAQELAGKFCLKRGNTDYGRLHLRKAFYFYHYWGAVHKIQDMKEKYGEYLKEDEEYDKRFAGKDLLSFSSDSLDLETVIRLSHVISEEIILEKLINKTMILLIENSGAQRVFLILESHGILNIEAQIEENKVTLIKSVPVKESENISINIIRYVTRTRETVVLANASEEGLFTDDPYIIRHKVRSILCMPLIHQDKLIGILYLENNISRGVFIRSNIEMLTILSSQLATSIENSRLYSQIEEYNRTLEQKVSERTEELKESLEKYKTIQKELTEARDAAQAANKTKSDFLSAMSHELRTPLNAVIGYARLLEEKSSLTEEEKRYINIIEKSGQHLLCLINDILDFSRIEAEKVELEKHPFNLKDLLTFIEGMVKIKADHKGLQFFIEYRKDLPASVLGDEKKVTQVLINLLSNAVKFTQTGSITFRIEKRHNRIFFSVEDTGTGIAAENLKDIFSPFKQLGDHLNKTEGTGLGLSISSNLVMLMGGELKVESIYGKGSKFWFEIELPEITCQSNKSKCLLPEMKPLKIILAEDNLTNRELAVHMLGNLGYRADTAANGIELLKVMEKTSYDLIFMDIQMPEMNGLEATKIIRERNSNIQIIAMTAYSRKEDLDKFIRAGMNDFMTKPINMEHIRRIITNVLNKKSNIPVIDEKISNYSGPKQDNMVFDHKLLLKRLEGNKKLLKKIISLSLDDLVSEFEKLKNSIKEGSLKKMKFHVHSIKGISLNVCAGNMKLTASAFEAILETEDMEKAESLIEELEREFEKFKEAAFLWITEV